MTVAILSGPPWLSLNSQSKLTGTAPAAGTYTAVLQSTVGPDTATATVTLIVTALSATAIAATSSSLSIGKIAISFAAFAVDQKSSATGFAIDFTATAGQPIPIVQPDANELNDQSFQATAIANGVASNNTMHLGDAYDWFTFTTTAAGPISLSLANLSRLPNAPSTALGIDCWLVDSQLNSAWSTDLSTASPSATSPSLQPDTYFLQVRNPVASPIATYTLTVTW